MFLSRFRRIWRRPPPPPLGVVRWSVLYNAGVTVALDGATAIEDLAFSLVDARLQPVLDLGEPILVNDIGALRIAYLALDRAVFDTPLQCRIQVESAGRRDLSGTIEIGPERFAGALDHVEDYEVVGWVSPLFNTETFEVQLVVDGEPEPPTRANMLRRDFIQLSAHGGWNGVRLPLPPRALDGRPHTLAMRAGEAAFGLPPWTARPRLQARDDKRGRPAGRTWDESLADSPLTVRILDRDVEVARTRTFADAGPGHDAGRTVAAFDLDARGLWPGLDIAVASGSGLRIGRIAGDPVARELDAARRSSRAILLAGDDPAGTLAARRATAEGTIASARERMKPGTLSVEAVSIEPLSIGTLDAEPVPAEAARLRRVGSGMLAIVPAYKGAGDLRACVESILPQLGVGGARLVVIDDASPEPEVAAYLQALAARDVPGVAVLANAVNLGFIQTVNRGLAELRPGEDAVLVNADTILPPGALERLAAACHAEAGIASVTPMSNTATVLSFPALGVPNPPPLGLDVAALDAAFAAAAGTGDAATIELPTGIGFCMYLNGAAIDEVGPLSPEWGRGYCEEVEWSLRARDLGWRHVATTGVFVMHEGSVSFGVAERADILDVNHVRLEAMFPEYLAEVQAFVRADPLAEIRARVFSRLMAGRYRRLTLHIVHGLGGGTQRYVDDLAALPRAPDHEFCIMRPAEGEFDMPILELDFQGAGARLRLDERRVLAAIDELERAGIAVRVQFNSRLGLSSAFLDAVARGTTPYGIMLHDFQWYCPKVTLIDETRSYCGEPAPELCQLCVRHGQVHDFADQSALLRGDLQAWLAFNRRVLARASEILAPSADTAERYGRRLGLAPVVRPHPEALDIALPAGSPPTGRGTTRIAIVGAIGDHKGYGLIRRMAELAEARRLPLYFRVVGYTRNDPELGPLTNIDTTGAYTAMDLKQRLDEFRPHFVLSASPWPETYSYVLSEAWQAGYPTVSLDIGAPADRIRATGLGTVVPMTRNADELLASLEDAAALLNRAPAARLTQSAPVSLEAYMGERPAETTARSA